MKTYLELIAETDRFPYPYTKTKESQQIRDNLFSLNWKDSQGSYRLGYVPSLVVIELLNVPESIRGEMNVNWEDRSIWLLQQQITEEERSKTVAALVAYWREKETFKLLKGWRNELWPVYDRKGCLLFSMERAAMGLFGTMRYGVHMVGYIEDLSAPFGIKIWVPKRASNKSTFPSMLDNTVAGGLMTGEDPFECIIREADEEASLPENIVRNGAKSVGTITYIYITDEKHIGENGYIYPECQWVYDLKLPGDVIPHPKDGEVEEFRLCDVDVVKEDLLEGKFKPNCALVMVDFFIRHGILKPDEVPELAFITQRMHRDIALPGPHQKSWHQAHLP